MIHYLTDERLKKIALGHEKDPQMTALEVKSVYLTPCRGKSGFIDAGQLNHISCIINCYFAFLLLLSIVSLLHTEHYFLFTF